VLMLELQIYGIFTHYAPEDERVYTYTKEYEDEKVIVLLNFTDEVVEFDVPEGMRWSGDVKDWIGNGVRKDVDLINGKMKLESWEGVVIVV